MTSKIENFLAVAKAADEHLLPIEKNDILKDLNSIPSAIVKPYVDAVTNYVEDLLHLRNIVLSAGATQTCQYLVNGLSENQIIRLRRIVDFLNSEDQISKVHQLLEANFGVVAPTEEGHAKATALINLIKSLDSDLMTAAKRLASLSYDLRTIAGALVTISMGHEFELSTLDGLSRIPLPDLDRLLEVCAGQVAYNEGKE